MITYDTDATAAIDASMAYDQIVTIMVSTREQQTDVVNDLIEAADSADLEYDSAHNGLVTEVWAMHPPAETGQPDGAQVWRVHVQMTEAGRG